MNKYERYMAEQVITLRTTIKDYTPGMILHPEELFAFSEWRYAQKLGDRMYPPTIQARIRKNQMSYITLNWRAFICE